MPPTLMPHQQTVLGGVGVLLGIVGIGAVLLGLGTALDFMYAQSHPVAPSTAFALKIEYTVGGMMVACIGWWLAKTQFASEEGTE